MATIPFELFLVDDVSHSDGSIDVSVLDIGPKGRNRWWRITRTADGGYYGLLLRAHGLHESFDDGVVLPRHMTVAFVMWLTFRGVW